MSERIFPTSSNRLAIDQNAQGHGVVALQDRGVAEIAHAVDVEHLLDQKRARQNQADLIPQAGGDRNQRIPQRVHENHAVFAQSLGKGGAHVVLPQIFHQRIFHQDGQRGERFDHVAQHGKEHVVESARRPSRKSSGIPSLWDGIRPAEIRSRNCLRPISTSSAVPSAQPGIE